MPNLSRTIMLSGDLEMSSPILWIQPPALPVWSQYVRHVYRSRAYLEELPPAIFPSLWLNEVGKSEKIIPAETLGIHSRYGDSYIVA